MKARHRRGYKPKAGELVRLSDAWRYSGLCGQPLDQPDPAEAITFYIEPDIVMMYIRSIDLRKGGKVSKDTTHVVLLGDKLLKLTWDALAPW